MSEIMEVNSAKLAGLQIDLLQKFKAGHITLDHLYWFNNLNKSERDALMAGKKPKGEILRQLYPNEVITACDRRMAVYELVKNADFVKMYGSLGADLEKLWMTKAQREAFCKEHHDKLRMDGYATFFLHKKDETKPAIPGNLEVAYVHVGSDGLDVRVSRFGHGLGWSADFRHRVVVPPP